MTVWWAADGAVVMGGGGKDEGEAGREVGGPYYYCEGERGQKGVKMGWGFRGVRV
jgi:hypothetical protein